MLSKEITGFIEMLKQDKASSRGHVMTAEDAINIRKGIDEKIGGYQDDTFMIKMIDKQETSGEFYQHKHNESKRDVLLFIHGGGFAVGSVESRRKLCMDILKESKMDGYSVDYGQWPEALHPKGLNDCVAAYKWLLSDGYMPENIHFFGESAGAMLVLTTLHYLIDNGLPVPNKACVFSPVAGQNLNYPSHTERDLRDPMITFEEEIPYYLNSDYNSSYVSPVKGDFSKFPPLYIHVGTEEVLYDDAVELYKKAKQDGANVKLKEWEGLFHVFPLFPSPETEEAIKDIANYYLD